ncbi:MAG TPA: class I SAM-dependent methyltransferase, partial [Thermoguttaceae bacterium]|nr:class I SAM-dependent methyltransferase [Thermoguttaceae bacterium]
MATTNTEVGGSHAAIRRRYANPRSAAKYPSVYKNIRRHQRERNTILKLFRHIEPGAHVLDIPCGTGRVTRLLHEAGFRVTGGDSSQFMVDLARQNHAELQQQSPSVPDVAFELRDVIDTGFDDNQFGAVFSNRLFHHFNEAETRRMGLAELRRISSGPVIVSFFNSFALDAVTCRLRHLLTGTKAVDRIPISMRTFAQDIAAAGLRIDAKVATRWGISR